MQPVGQETSPTTAAAKKFFPQKFAGVGKAKKPKPVPNAVKKKRTNFRLRKIIVPKAPLMVLNEMVGSVSYSFVDNPPMPPMQAGLPHLFTAQCIVDGETFTGTGPSKQIAKNICAEHAIQAVVSKRCTDPKNKNQVGPDGEPLKPNQMEDETPWAQLASLALFKLFNDWQAQGYQLPKELLKAPDMGEYNASENPGQEEKQPAPKPLQPAKKVPDNPTERHPVQLLNELRGGVQYALVSETGTPPNTIFTMGCDIDGTTHKGDGKNKKEAKRQAALAALKAVYNIVYPETIAA